MLKTAFKQNLSVCGAEWVNPLSQITLTNLSVTLFDLKVCASG